MSHSNPSRPRVHRRVAVTMAPPAVVAAPYTSPTRAQAAMLLRSTGDLSLNSNPNTNPNPNPNPSQARAIAPPRNAVSRGLERNVAFNLTTSQDAVQEPNSTPASASLVSPSSQFQRVSRAQQAGISTLPAPATPTDQPISAEASRMMPPVARLVFQPSSGNTEPSLARDATASTAPRPAFHTPATHQGEMFGSSRTSQHETPAFTWAQAPQFPPTHPMQTPRSEIALATNYPGSLWPPHSLQTPALGRFAQPESQLLAQDYDQQLSEQNIEQLNHLISQGAPLPYIEPTWRQAPQAQTPAQAAAQFFQQANAANAGQQASPQAAAPRAANTPTNASTPSSFSSRSQPFTQYDQGGQNLFMPQINPHNMMLHQLGNERPVPPADQQSRGSGRSSGARSSSNPPPPPQSPPPSDSDSVASSGNRSNQSTDSARRARTSESHRGPPVHVPAELSAQQAVQRLAAAHRQARNAHYPDRQLAEKRMEQDLTPSTREMVDYITSRTNHQPGEQAPHYKDVISDIIANCPQCRSQRNMQGCQELGIDINTMNCQAQEQQNCAACQLPVSRHTVPECDSCRASFHPACGKFKRVDEGYDTLKDADGEKIQSPKVCESCRGVHRQSTKSKSALLLNIQQKMISSTLTLKSIKAYTDAVAADTSCTREAAAIALTGTIIGATGQLDVQSAKQRIQAYQAHQLADRDCIHFPNGPQLKQLSSGNPMYQTMEQRGNHSLITGMLQAQQALAANTQAHQQQMVLLIQQQQTKPQELTTTPMNPKQAIHPPRWTMVKEGTSEKNSGGGPIIVGASAEAWNQFQQHYANASPKPGPMQQYMSPSIIKWAYGPTLPNPLDADEKKNNAAFMLLSNDTIIERLEKYFNPSLTVSLNSIKLDPAFTSDHTQADRESGVPITQLRAHGAKFMQVYDRFTERGIPAGHENMNFMEVYLQSLAASPNTMQIARTITSPNIRAYVAAVEQYMNTQDLIQRAKIHSVHPTPVSAMQQLQTTPPPMTPEHLALTERLRQTELAHHQQIMQMHKQQRENQDWQALERNKRESQTDRTGHRQSESGAGDRQRYEERNQHDDIKPHHDDRSRHSHWPEQRTGRAYYTHPTEPANNTAPLPYTGPIRAGHYIHPKSNTLRCIVCGHYVSDIHPHDPCLFLTHPDANLEPAATCFPPNRKFLTWIGLEHLRPVYNGGRRSRTTTPTPGQGQDRGQTPTRPAL